MTLVGVTVAVVLLAVGRASVLGSLGSRRRAARTELSRLLSGTRLVTLTGPPVADSPHAVLARNILGNAHVLAGDPAASMQILRESLTICQAAGDTTLLLVTLVHLARAEWLAGKLSDAAEHVRASVGLQATAPTPILFAQAVELMAWITADAGDSADLRRAAVMLGAADRTWHDFGLTRLKRVPYYEATHQRCAAKVRAGLGDAAFLAAFARGADMPTTEIYGFITGTGGLPPVQAQVDDTEPATTLTSREQEVADLITAGLSNRQIATELYVSQRTAESHVQHILTKLGFTSRSQVAAYIAASRPPDGDRGEQRWRPGGACPA
jgi:DNA-binding NarL/FixJ family response regulator